MRFLRRSLVGIFLLSVTVALLAVAGDMFYDAFQDRLNREARSRPAREQVTAVNTVTIQLQDVAPELVVFGEVRSRRTLDLRATAAGRILLLSDNFEEGGRVARGDLLAQIDPVTAQSAIDVAQTDKVEAEAELRDAERALVLAGDELEAAKSQVDLRAQALRRQQDLQTRGVGTEAAIEAAALALSSADQAVLARRQTVAQAESRIDQAKTRLARLEISLLNAQRDLADTEVRASFAGTLAEVTAVAGGVVTANEKIAQLVDPSALEVSFRVSTAQYARLIDADGDLIQAPVNIALDVFGLDLTVMGQLDRVSAAVGEGQTGRLIFATINGSAGFRPGDFVTVIVTEPMLSNVALVPATAVDAANTVLVVGENDRLRSEAVQIMRRQGDDLLINASQIADQRIVAERSPLVGPGLLVRVLETPTAEGSAPASAAEPAREMVELSPERRAKLIAFVEANKRMPSEAKERVLSQLAKNKVPVRMVERIESRMGG